MRITAKIAEHLGWCAECRLGVYDPPLFEKRIDKSGKPLRVRELGCRAEKNEIPFSERLSQSFYELGSKNGAQHVHRQEEGVFRVNPAFPVGGESARRDYTVYMRMKQ